MWMYNHNFHAWTLLPPGGWNFFIFLLALLWGIMTFDFILLKKYMRWVILISGILFWIQFILLILTGSLQICFVPNLTGEFTYEGFTYADIVAKHLNDNLPYSIFLEKSYLAYYFLTYLALIWFETDNKEKLFTKECLFVIGTLIASRSGTALVGFSILLAIKMLNKFWTTNISNRIILIIFIIPLVVGSIYTYISTEFGQEMLSRSSEFSTESSSGYTRVVGGYLMFDRLSAEQKIIGISDPRNRFGTENWDGRIVFFANGVQTILLSLGYIGALLYLLFYARIFRKVSLTARMCIVVLFVMSLLESNYLNPYMMLLTIIPCANLYKKRLLL